MTVGAMWPTEAHPFTPETKAAVREKVHAAVHGSAGPTVEYWDRTTWSRITEEITHQLVKTADYGPQSIEYLGLDYRGEA